MAHNYNARMLGFILLIPINLLNILIQIKIAGIGKLAGRSHVSAE
jgi:hypothetical protein